MSKPKKNKPKKNKIKQKVPASVMQPPIAPLKNECCEGPAQEPDPKVVSAAWNLDRWVNRIRNAEEALATIDQQRQNVVDEIMQMRLKFDLAKRDVLSVMGIDPTGLSPDKIP